MKIFCALLLVGLAAGVSAGLLILIIRALELLAFGHVETAATLMTDNTTPLQRFLALTLVGLVVAGGWYQLQKRLPPLTSIPQLMAGQSASLVHNAGHAVLQMVAVGAGASIGRETAPRELAALGASLLTKRFALDADSTRLLVACGAGAGLGASYNIPLAGAFFTLEVLLQRFDPRSVGFALATSALATVAARFAIDDQTVYLVGAINHDLASVLLATLIGLLVALPALGFRWLSAWATRNRSRGKTQLWTLPLALMLTGLLAIWWHQILGNGRSVAQSAYWDIGWMPALALLLAKALVTLLTLRAGGFGGVLTPAIALGALAGLLVGWAGRFYLPTLDLNVATLAGSVGFLAVSMNAPLSAWAIVMGLTGQDFADQLPMLSAVGAAVLMKVWLAPKLGLEK